MGIFNKKEEAKKEADKAKKTTKSKAKKEAKVVNLSLVDSDLVNKSLVQPWITEKTHELMGLGKYVFKVTKRANKKDVKKSIEALYGVIVEEVTIINIPAKKKRFGRTQGKRSGYKKAVATLKQGDKINLFEGA